MKIGITLGDINGIGPEVLIKALSDERMLKFFTPVIYGSSKMLAYHKNITDHKNFQFSSSGDVRKVVDHRVNVVNCWEETNNITLGKATEEGGKLAQIALDRASEDLKNKHIDAIVTLPINKAAMQMAKFNYPGHTEYFSEKFSGDSIMMLLSGELRVALATNHLPLKDVAAKLNKELIDQKIRTLYQSLVMDFGIEKPMIAVLGLNPHAGDDGAIGTEEDKIIRPAIIEAKKKGILAAGPYPADGFFGSSTFKKFDAILAMYHDQGLIPFKALSFGNGVNYTAGLRIIRTSPDHGTAYDIAGQNLADESSLRQAIFTAIDIFKNKKRYAEDHANPLNKRQRPSDIDGEDEIVSDL